MTAFLIILIFILGASLGSFLSVVIDRIKHRRKGILFGRSACPHCKNKLGTLDLIPILSFITLKGQCRYCGKPISPHYLSLEVITGIVFTTLFFRYPFLSQNELFLNFDTGLMLNFVIACVTSVFLIAIFFYDLLHSEIPDIFLFPLIGIAFVGSLILGTPDLVSMLIAAAIALVFYGGQHLASKGKWLGEGDIYLSIGTAFILGWQQFLASIVITYIIGGCVATYLLLNKKVTGKTQIPFAPFIILGTLVTIFFGEELLQWYLGTLTF